MLPKVSVIVIGVCCLLIFATTARAASVDCNIDECRKPMKIYEELGCKPIYGSKSCCPKRFECPDDIKVAKDEDKCTYQGVSFAIGEVLPRQFTNESKCLEACICTSRYEDEAAMFVCSSSDCGISSFRVPGCINIFGDVNECCSTSIVCDDEEKQQLASCWDDGVEYREGEKFISKSDPCYECVCHADFDNATIAETPHCRKLNCEIELKYKWEIQRGCLPIFDNDKCCPVDWKCPDRSRKFKRSPADVNFITLSKEVVEDASETSPPTTTEVVTEESTTEEIQMEPSTTTDTPKDTTLSIDEGAVEEEKTIIIEAVKAETTEKAEESTTTEQISITEAAEVKSSTKADDEEEEEATIVTPTESTATTTEVRTTELTFSEPTTQKSQDEESMTSTTEAVTTTITAASSSQEQKEAESTTTVAEREETTESAAETTTSQEQTLPPAAPTAIAMLVTTLKEFLSNIQLSPVKASEDAEPASFVNYTISRSLSVKEKEEEESKSIAKRSLDSTPPTLYTKHSSKEKGCSFGQRQYKVGEEIKTDNECLVCFCNYAPIGHCIRKEKCIA